MSGSHRVVFDTSTLVSAALRVGSTPHQALKQAISQGEVCVSSTTLSELQQVLSRPKFDQYLPHEMRGEFVDLVRAAAVLVSSDADLLVLHPWRGVPIHTPGAYLLWQV